MAYCSKCGKELADGAKYCPVCGSPTNAPGYYAPGPGYVSYPKEETGVVAWGILSFVLTCLTAVGGLILCLVLYGCGKPRSGFAALVGMLLTIVVGIVGLIILIAMSAASNSSTAIIDLIIG